jgi:tRNA-splicing ligase RtcB
MGLIKQVLEICKDKIMNYKIFGEDLIDKSTISQFLDAVKQPWVVKASLMPDAHVGMIIPIGSVIATEGVISPHYVGADIGCGISACKCNISERDIIDNAKEILKEINNSIPMGVGNGRSVKANWNYKDIPHTEALKEIYNKTGILQLGSLGSGNHFIEIGKDTDNNIWIAIHSGSRGLGSNIGSIYQKYAVKESKTNSHPVLSIDSSLGKDYITDLNFCLEYALENRKVMLESVLNILARVLKVSSVTYDTFINRHHNHAELVDGVWIHRKGATHANKGMLGVIPGSMKSGFYITEGLGNPESLNSTSHGAGRILSRKDAKALISEEEHMKDMTGIFSNKPAQHILDESPNAYKDLDKVINAQKSLLKVVTKVTPIINIKG